MKLLKDNAVLEGVTCCAYFAERRLVCPRNGYPYRLEVWPERVPPQ